MGRQKKLWNIFYPLPNDLAFMDCPFFCSWRWLGLSSFGERFDPWLGSSTLKKKGIEVVAGYSPWLNVGDLEGQEQNNF